MNEASDVSKAGEVHVLADMATTAFVQQAEAGQLDKILDELSPNHIKSILDALSPNHIKFILRTISTFAENENVHNAISNTDELLCLMNYADPNPGYLRGIKDGNELVHKSVYNYNTPLLNELILRKADVNVEDEFGATPLFTAIAKGNHSALNSLIEAKADVNHVARDGFKSMLRTSEDYPDATGLELLGQNITPLHAAAVFGNHTNIKNLLKAGVNPNAVSSDGNTALHYLAIRTYIRDQITIRGKDAYPDIVYHRTGNSQVVEIAQMLFRAGADINTTNADGNTALDLIEAFDSHTDLARSYARRMRRVQNRPGCLRNPRRRLRRNRLHRVRQADEFLPNPDFIQGVIKNLISVMIEKLLRNFDLQSILKTFLAQASQPPEVNRQSVELPEDRQDRQDRQPLVNEILQDLGTGRNMNFNQPQDLELIAQNIIQAVANSAKQ